MDDCVPSPCRKICQLSQDGQLCVGCGRTLGEITGWPTMTSDERRVASKAASARLAGLAAR
ncbi:hypothetical protein Ga0102493_11144 [Erythrobacter litoralis]|jgi:predicted Fe-S protein YdhL (DUF1289 family)|uniref:DUF1289 domain-containing protein n=1 Tax=Erythrobacter TaxID=1041 RepID=UPI000556805B|nr:DUF1289 domain-containing protein [Erythrobacter litoralis]AOL24288.1 hypothetical protein Ga0102493_11144 [Erythrobacter litoralis]MEE4338960.1 DUF1289 domain-containing protein [Erythrobacter sp.]